MQSRKQITATYSPKRASLALVLSMVMLLFVGCGKSSKNETTSSAVNSTVSASTTQASTQTDPSGSKKVQTEATEGKGFLQGLKRLLKGESKKEQSDKPAHFGEQGKKWALELATNYPDRFAGSEQEKKAADYLFSKLQELGYEVERQEFQFTVNEETYTSRNLNATIKGVGMQKAATDVLHANKKREVATLPADVEQYFNVIGAHYDTPNHGEVVDGVEDIADGIHDNASGVASLLVLAANVQKTPPVYDTKLVFFGAGSAKNQPGASHYLSQLSDADKGHIACMYNVDSIYAGNKVYAHSGWSSVQKGEQIDYNLRDPLYNMLEVYYQNRLLTNNNFELYTNQNTSKVPFFEDGEKAIYREWTNNVSDHTPFDRAKIPVVYLESYEYNNKVSDLKRESTDPGFSAVGGNIKGSALDSSSFLQNYFSSTSAEQVDPFGTDATAPTGDAQTSDQLDKKNDPEINDRLINRINNVAFLLQQSIRFAPVGYEVRK